MEKWRYSSIILNFGSRWKCVVRFKFPLLYSRGNNFQHPLDGRLRGPQGRSQLYREERNLLLLPGTVPRFLGRPVRCVVTTPLIAVPNHLMNINPKEYNIWNLDGPIEESTILRLQLTSSYFANRCSSVSIVTGLRAVSRRIQGFCFRHRVQSGS
jgi:hypothetical protein